jgi:hypothetical protein
MERQSKLTAEQAKVLDRNALIAAMATHLACFRKAIMFEAPLSHERLGTFK